MTNGGNTQLGLKSTDFVSKNITLTRDLNFKSIFSYNDYKTTMYGDLNTDGIVEEIRTELTKTDDGCIGFSPIGFNTASIFKGNIDGQGNEIQNIYINTASDAAFIYKANKNISNLGITGKIIGQTSIAGLVANGDQNLKIENCYNKCDLFDYTSKEGVAIYGMGGIVGTVGAKDVYINNCYNLGKIYSENTNYYCGIGGIVGNNYGYTTVNINKCYNMGEIIGSDYVRRGGIIGYGGKIISNSYNLGKSNGAGITGNPEVCKIINCYNLGNSSKAGISYGYYNDQRAVISNVYTLYTNIKGGGSWGETFENAYYPSSLGTLSIGTAISEKLMKADGSNDTEDEKALVTLLNEYVTSYNEEHKEDVDFTELLTWKIDEKTGYPAFNSQ